MPVLDTPAVQKLEGVLVVDADALDSAALQPLLEGSGKTLVLRGSERGIRARVADLGASPRLVPLPPSVPDASAGAVVSALVDCHQRLVSSLEIQGRMELELRHTQKMDAVGQLASGIAHEINTPIQFVGDSVFFLQGAFEDLVALLELMRSLVGEEQVVSDFMEEIDLTFLLEEIPRAFERTRGGCDRVSTIVRAMRHFARADAVDAAPADLVGALKSTVVVASNEVKFVADVELDLEPLPLVTCRLGDLNQVFLNLRVNAAHAIADADRGRGTIRVSTRALGEHVEIRISDTGCGIPDAIQSRIFEPFFTTKAIGRGTGQGLAISHAIVVERHGGELRFETSQGEGTTFIVRLPVQPRRSA